MSLKYLFGPIDSTYADDNLSAVRGAGDCLAFNSKGDLDLSIHYDDGWDQVLRQLPSGWLPDFIALFLPFAAIPTCLWSAPVPLVGLAGDWHLLWHQYRLTLPICDLVFTDVGGVEALAKEGITAIPGNLFGCARSFLAEGESPSRDIDVLYAGSLHPAEQKDRLPWLWRVVQAAGERWNVVIRTTADREEYLDLLKRARILFNRSVRGECNLRVFEAAATGALLFQETENREVRQYLRDGSECVFYSQDTLEDLLQYYLSHEQERSRIAAAAQHKAPDFSFVRLWTEMLEAIEPRLAELAESAYRRSNAAIDINPDRQMWESLNCSTRTPSAGDVERSLARNLHQRIASQPRADWHNILGLAAARRCQREGHFDHSCASEAAEIFRRAVESAPENVMFRLNLAESLWRLGSAAEAAAECARALASLEGICAASRDDLSGGHFPPAFDSFRVEWERAAWSHPGDYDAERRAKVRLVEWRLHSVLGALTSDLGHYRRAAQLRDDLWTSHAALGRASAVAGMWPETAACLCRASQLNPFDESLARDLVEALRAAGDRDGVRTAIEGQRLLKRATARNPPVEIRFAQEVTGAVG